MLNFLEENIVEYVVEDNLTAQNVKLISVEIRKEIEQLGDFKRLYVDLSKVEMIDSIGLSFLVALFKLLSSQGKTMSIKKYNAAILEILKIMRLDEMFEID